MKKLLLLISGLLLFFSVEGQILRYSNYTAPAPPSEDYNFQVTRYITGLSTPLNDSVTEKINTFVVALCDSLNIDSLAQVFDIMYVFANGNEEAALRNLVKRDHDCSATGSPTFTAFEGFTGDGTDAYLNTYYSPGNDGVNLTQNSASIGICSRTNVSADNQMDIGVRTSGTDIDLLLLTYSTSYGGFFSRINVATSNVYASTSTSVGYFISARNGSAITDQVSYINKTTPSQNTSGTNTTGAPSVGNLYILANNNGGTPGDFTTRQIAFAFAGEYITTAMRDDIVDCFEAYMDSNGKGVL